MAIIQKSSFAQHLETYPVFITDTAEFSRYFKISQLPDTFTGGKNAFLIQGTSELADGTYLMIEIKDSRGRVIYTEPAGGKPSNYYEGTSKPVAVHIYPDTTFGPCTITILGELVEYELNGVKYPIPDNWVGRPNVKWQKKVNVNPTLANTTPVRFYKRPTIELTEVYFPIWQRQVTFTPLSGYLKGHSVTPEDGTEYPYNSTTVYTITSGNPADFEWYISGRSRPLYGAYPSASSVPFSRGLIGKDLTFTNIRDIYTNLMAPGTWTTKITSLYSDYQAYIENPYLKRGFPQTYKDIGYAEWTGTAETVDLQESGISASYINVKLSNLDTFSGDAYRIKVWSKSKSTIKDFELIEDRLIEPVELLQDSYYQNTLNPKTGFFIDNTFLNFYWKITNLDTTGNTLELDIDRAGYAKVYPTTNPDNSTGLIKFEPQNEALFSYGTEYQLSFDTIFVGSSNSIGSLDIYVSGSLPATGSPFINTNDTFGKKVLSLNANTFRDFGAQTINFKADNGTDGYGKITFNVLSGNWDIANISLKPSKQSAFTPNEISFLINPNIQIVSESFDFRIELFDINYNYIPVKLNASAQFRGGNNLVPQLRVTVPTSPTFSVLPNGFDASPPFIDIPYQTIVETSQVSFYSSSYGTAYTYPDAFSRNGSRVSAVVLDPGPPKKWQDITDDYPYPGKLTDIVPATVTSTGQTGTKRIYWEDFSSSLKGVEVPFGLPDSPSNEVPRTVERVKYYVTCAALTPVTFEIYADRSNVTTTTTTTTTSTTTTSTTTTSTTTTSTTTTPLPGNVDVSIYNNTTAARTSRLISDIKVNGSTITLEYPWSYPITPGQLAVSIIPNISNATVVINISNTINGENIQVGDALQFTTASISTYTFTGVDFTSTQPSLLNYIQLYA